MVPRVIATGSAEQLIERLIAKHGPVMFHLSRSRLFTDEELAELAHQSYRHIKQLSYAYVAQPVRRSRGSGESAHAGSDSRVADS